MKTTLSAGLAIVAMTAALFGQGSRQASVTLQAAIAAETVEQDLGKAIRLYEQAIKEAGGDRGLVASTLLRLAQAHDRAGRETDAQATYQRIVREYSDSGEPATTARARLAAAEAKLRLGASATAQGRGASQSPPFQPSHALDRLDPGGDFSLSPDGAFAIQSRGKSLVVRELSTDKERVVTDLGDAELSVVRWSPDGRRIAFAVNMARTGQRGRSELRLATVATGDVRVVAGEDQQAGSRWALSWSADTERLAFGYLASGATPRRDRSPRAIGLVTVSTGEVRTLDVSTEGPAPAGFAWSPDGRRLAVHVIDQKQTVDEVHIVDVATGQRTRLQLPPPAADAQRVYPGPGDLGLVASMVNLRSWTSQNELELLESTRGPGSDRFNAMVLSLNGEARTICDHDANSALECLRFTRDARWFVIRNRTTRRLVIRDVKTGVDRLLTSGSGEEDSPISSPDGLLLSFLSNRDGRWGLYVAPVDQAPVANPIRLATLEKRPDVRGITFRHWFDNGRIVNGFYYQDRGLYRFDLDPATARVKGAPVSLNTDTSERTFPAVSPDGRQIASWSRDGVKTGIAISDRDGAGARLVLEHALRPSVGTQPGGTGVPLVWRSPDEIVFYEWAPRPGETEGFRILTISRGAVTPLPYGENQPFVAGFSSGTYVPSRHAIVFRTGGNVGRSESIKVRMLADGSERTLTTATSLGSIAVSADGRSVAYSHLAYTDPVRDVVPAEIRVVSFEGTGDRALATASGDIRDYSRRRFLVESWTPNGTRLLFRNESGQLRMMDVMSGASTAFVDQAGPVWNEGAWAPDGSFLVLRGYSERAHWSNFEGVSYEAVMRLMSRPGPR